MLSMCLVTANALKKTSSENNLPQVTDTINTSSFGTIYIPIYVGTSSFESSTGKIEDSSDNEMRFIVREYKGKIGIFLDNGELYQIIDVYVKTLPKADRDLLEEGIEIKSTDELRDIIEDYTG